MRAGSNDARTVWRNACVVRAQTIAAHLRMIEFAVEGGLPAFRQGARTRVRAGQPDFSAGRSHVCVYVGQDRMRVLVAGGEDSPGARFMWALVEGARVRLTVPAAPTLTQADRPAGMRLVCAGVRMELGSGASRQGRRGRAGPAANRGFGP